MKYRFGWDGCQAAAGSSTESEGNGSGVAVSGNTAVARRLTINWTPLRKAACGWGASDCAL